MALKISFPDKTDGICTDAYVVADLTLDNKTKKGRLELAVWKEEGYRRGAKQKINNVPLPIGDNESWFKKPELVEGEEDQWIGYVTQLAWDDFAWKTGKEVYTKIKTLKVLVDGSIVDLSDAVDV